MKITITKTYDTPTHLLREGMTYDLDPALAKQVMDSGHAEPVTEAAVIAPQETASTRPKTRRKRKAD